MTAGLLPRHRRLPGVQERQARLTAESALIGLISGIAVVAPWTRDGYLLLLDWVAGPHQTLTPGLYGLDPAALDALPYRLATQALRNVVGPGATSWLLILLYFPIAASGISAAVGGSRARRYPAALFVCCNPFVVERLQAGHVAFLLSTALLCWLLASALRARRRGTWFAARPAGWFALAMAVGPHAAWLGGGILAAVALLPRPGRRDVIRTAVAVVTAAGIYAYAVVVISSAILTVRVGLGDLEVYAPHAGTGGLFVTLASLRGFWRGAADSSPQVSLGLIAGGAMVLGAATGLGRLWRREPLVGRPLALLAVAGLLLGAGINGPLAGLYRFAFTSLPLFEAMREQQKWVALTMIAYAAGVGAAAEFLAELVRYARVGTVRIVAAGCLIALGSGYAGTVPSLVWGLGGSVRVSHYPSSWYAADRIMGAGTEAILFLPWHQYQPFNFTAARSVATPAGAFFRRPVLSSDAVELGVVRTNSASRRTAYVQRLVVDGGTGELGRMLAPLGIRYVVLARDREAEAYEWLDYQDELTAVLRTDELILYRVEASGTGRVVSARTGDYASTVELAREDDLGSEAVLSAAPGMTLSGPVPSSGSGGLRRMSSTTWRVSAGEAGWVVIPEEWSAGWSAGAGMITRPTVAGTVAVHAGADAVTVRYTPWRYLRLGLAASVLSLLLLLAVGLAEHRRDIADWWTAPRPERVRRRGPPGPGRRPSRPEPAPPPARSRAGTGG